MNRLNRFVFALSSLCVGACAVLEPDEAWTLQESTPKSPGSTSPTTPTNPCNPNSGPEPCNPSSPPAATPVELSTDGIAIVTGPSLSETEITAMVETAEKTFGSIDGASPGGQYVIGADGDKELQTQLDFLKDEWSATDAELAALEAQIKFLREFEDKHKAELQKVYDHTRQVAAGMSVTLKREMEVISTKLIVGSSNKVGANAIHIDDVEGEYTVILTWVGKPTDFWMPADSAAFKDAAERKKEDDALRPHAKQTALSQWLIFPGVKNTGPDGKAYPGIWHAAPLETPSWKGRLGIVFRLRAKTTTTATVEGSGS
jgi:hypothetical protein